MPHSRRSFLQAAAAMPAVSALSVAAEPLRQPELPTVAFGKHRITRMIIGSNPLYGYSHFNRVLDAHFKEYFTPEQKLKLLMHAEAMGINTWQVHYNDQPAGHSPVDDYKRYRAAGGKMNLVLLPTSG